MSRPQLQYNTTPAQNPHSVVNGGLIDFSDNLHRGNVESLTPSMLVSMQQNQNHMMMMQQQQQPGLVPSSTTMASAGVFPNGPSYISGPPTFLHVNGIMYRPVDASSGPQVDAQPSPVPAAPETKVLSASELHKEIDKRVQAKVQDYINEHRHPADTEADQGEVAARRVRDLNASMPSHPPARTAAQPNRVAIQGRW